MLDLLHRTYFAVFHRYPVLVRMALVVLLGEILFASVTNYALPFYVSDDLRQPGRVLGILVSTFLIAEMLLKLPFGHLSDRHGRRRFAVLGLTLGAIAPLAVFLIPTELLIAVPVLIYALLMPLRVVDGAAGAALWPPLFAAVPDHVPPSERGVAMSVMNTAYLAGLALGWTLAGLTMKLVAATGAQGHWVGKAPFAMAALAAVSGAAIASTLPADHPTGDQVGERPVGSFPPARTIAIIMIITFGNMFATSTLGPYLALYVRDVGRMDPSNVGPLLLLLFIPAGILGIPAGHLADRWPRRRVVQVALATAAIGVWAVPLCRSLVPMMLAGVVVVLGFLLGLPAWLALITDLAPEGARGKMMGIMATAQGLGAFLGPLIGGFLWDLDHRGPFYLAAAFLTCSAVTALLFLSQVGAGDAAPAAEPSAASELPHGP